MSGGDGRPDPGQVRHLPEERRYVLELPGGTSLIDYRTFPDGSQAWVHTEVPPALGGRGVGSALVKGALALAREAGVGVHPYCPFVHTYIQRHPEYADMVPAEYPRRGELGG